MKTLRKATKGLPAFLVLLGLSFPSLATVAEQEERSPLASLEGLVVDSRTRQPVAGAWIGLERGRVPSGLRVQSREAMLSALTDEFGRFRLEGIQPGVYTLVAAKQGYVPSPFHELEIKSRKAVQIPEIVLVAWAEISGRVTDQAGKPIAGAIVSGRAGEEISEEIVSDSDGRFVLSEFPSGASVFLWAEAPGHSQAKELVTAPQIDLVLVLRPHGMLRGRVEDADTKGSTREFRMWMAHGLDEKSFRSTDGSFEWSGLPAGRWTFVAQAPGYQSAELRGVEIRPGEATEGIIFQLRKGVELPGRALDDETGEALPDVNVGYHDSSKPEDPEWPRFSRNTQTTDAEGNFKFEAVPPVNVTIIAKSPLHAEDGRR